MNWTYGIDKEALERANAKAGSYYQRSEANLKSRLKLNIFERVLIFLGFDKLVEDMLIKKKLKEIKNHEK